MIDSRTNSLNIQFDPLIPDIWFAAIIGAALVLFALACFRARKGLVLRTLTFAVFILALLNPSWLEEERILVSDVAVIVVDQSQSQKTGLREQRTDSALVYLQEKMGSRSDLELRIVRAPVGDTLNSETILFDALDEALADIPTQRRAGVIILSDGQIHDVPQNPALYDLYGPVHLLLSGEHDEKDRQIVITEAPAYGITGQKIAVKYRIEDTDNIRQDSAAITISQPGERPEMLVVPTNQDLSLNLPVNHAGQNVFEIHVQNVPGELTQSNNRAAIIVNGVRDRLRVLLVSGKPHAGGRSWRDLLRSDPGVDLVHFTILRDPGKLDATPQDELSLIAFPFQELFEYKLNEFDLVIFDRYRLSRILPDKYFDNIAHYVERGGALLEASGPAFASENSLYLTSLRNVLPGIPTGEVIERPFQPAITKLGQKHPVTENLQDQQDWGSWLRQVAIEPKENSDVLMSGADDLPLLVLSRMQDGRVAQIASDHLWLWARGYESGGPYTELLRRVVHWLMKEPELDEKALNVKVTDGDKITVESRNIKAQNNNVTMTHPDGTQETLTLSAVDNGLSRSTVTADHTGIYGFEDSEGQKRFAVVGELNPPELRGLIATKGKLAPLLEASGGGALWLSDAPQPDIRLMAQRRSYAGRNWIGLRHNNEFAVKSVHSRPVLPDWAAALLLLVLMIGTWWRESRA